MSGFLPGFLLAIAPVLLLVALLLRGTYPGERVLEVFRRVVSIVLSRHVARSAPSPALDWAEWTTRRDFIGTSLSGRGPPRRRFS